MVHTDIDKQKIRPRPAKKFSWNANMFSVREIIRRIFKETNLFPA